MKKLFLLFLVGLVLTPDNGISQVAKIENELISDDEIILIGPLNVDTYFPEQAKKYISEYEKIVDELNLLINYFESELEYFKKNKITKVFKKKQYISAIEKITIELELLDDFILLWEEHDLNFNSFNNDFEQNFKSDNCYSFIIGEDTYNHDEIEIVEVSPKKELRYYEFINGDYLEVFRKLERQAFDEKIHNSKCIMRTKDKSKEFVICVTGYILYTSNVLEKFEKNRETHGMTNGKFQKQLLEEDNLKVIKRMEHLFSEFHFDKDEKEFYKKKNFKNPDTFFQIRLKAENKQVIPDSWSLTECK